MNRLDILIENVEELVKIIGKIISRLEALEKKVEDSLKVNKLN